MALAIYIAIAVIAATAVIVKVAVGFFGKRNPDGEELTLLLVLGVRAAFFWPVSLAVITLNIFWEGAAWLLRYFHRRQWEWRDRRKHLL